MASAVAGPGEVSQGLDGPVESNGAAAAATSSSKLSRKRTKTGCLTCRKRRIKCGEERPICNNCIKSKRHCEGYNQRVVFKPPTMDWRTAPHGGPEMIPYHGGMISRGPSIHSMQHSMVGPTLQLAQIRPRPSSEFDFSNLDSDATVSMEPLSASSIEPGSTPYRDQFANVAIPESPFQPPHGFYAQNMSGRNPHEAAHHIHHGLPTPAYAQNPSPVALNGARSSQTHGQMQHGTVPETAFAAVSPSYDLATSMGYSQAPPPTQIGQTAMGNQPALADHQLPSPLSNPSRRATHQFGVAAESWRAENQQNPLPSPALSHGRGPELRQGDFKDAKQFGHQARTGSTVSLPNMDHKKFAGQVLTTPFAPALVSPTQLLDEAAIEVEDDDYYDVDVNDDMDVDIRQALPPGSDSQREFGTMLALHRANTDDMSVRRYDSFLYEGILDYYRPERVASPLKNPQTARVFAHFIHATGPSLSIFERNPRNASALFSDTPVPTSQQSLWTYTLPMMALHHQGLLHAMLALASLHIARLQGASVTPSFKHYAYALKRIHHNVGHPEKRHLLSTVAASLLLGYYEVITGDQLKWSSHLLGAKQLIVEIDFPGMVKEYKRVKAERRAEQAAAERAAYGMLPPSEVVGTSYNPFGLVQKTDPGSDGSVDESLISTLIGRKVRYDEFGRVIEDTTSTKRPYNPKFELFDPIKFEALQDLYWFYCKQDMYQSLLGGDQLLMDFERWSDCPPRCAIGRGDEAYGTFDHLSLLLARIADFAARDRKRKIKAIQANGGSWRPPPNMQFPGLNGPSPTPGSGGPSPFSPSRPGPQSEMPPPSTPISQAGFSAQKSPAHPPAPQMPFYGMAPLPPQRMPSSYGRQDPNTFTGGSPKDQFDPVAALEAAMEDWTQIRSALNAFASHLGPSFQPLSAEVHQPIPTPFGDALQYRSYDIGVIWALYHMAHIIVIRSHPGMPPAAMVAAGVAASQTAPMANLIGRITAGIVPSPPNLPLNPSLGAALIESTMALFFAGIQYIDPSQRSWLVTRVRDIEARTGWASVGLIASGCETAWVKAAEAGRGPPYERVRDRTSMDERISGITMEDTSEPPKDPSDRRFVQFSKGTRLHWAIGIIGLEEDVPKTPVD